MRILLDENMPHEFGVEWTEHQIDHVDLIGMKGVKNGALMTFARLNYDAFVSRDRGILFQHRHEGPMIIIVIRTADAIFSTILARQEAVLATLRTAQAGDLIELPINRV